MVNTLLIQKRKPLSISVQAAATVLAVVAAVAVPQFFHWLGIVSGAGKAPGVAFSPMHLPIILVGFLAGPYAGLISGLLGPVVAHYMSGMPNAMQLPFMMVELAGYGLSAGLLRSIRLPLVAKTLVALIAGRLFRMIACVIAFYLLGNEKMLPMSIWTSIPRVLPGIVLQLVLIPLIVFRVENRGKADL